jgi:outer membrane lipoprotein-sorting protein
MYPPGIYRAAAWIAAGISILLPRDSFGQQTGRGILVEMDSLQSLVHSEISVIEMRLFDEDRLVRSRTLELKTLVTNGSRYALSIFTEPADIRGLGLLTVEAGEKTEQKLYLPALQRVQRIAGSARRDRFAGSDFSYEDLTSRRPDDYASTLVGNAEGLWKIELTPLDESSAYDRIEITVDSARTVITQARYFDESGDVTKILTSSDFVEVRPKVWKPETMTMRDVRDKTRTELHYLSRANDTDLTPDTFTERQLRRGA